MITYSKIKNIWVLAAHANTYTLFVDDPLHQFVADCVITQNSGGDSWAIIPAWFQGFTMESGQ